MIKVNKFYMHRQGIDSCVKVLRSLGNGMFEAQWHSIGVTGEVWPTMAETQQLHMHPDVWHDVTELVKPTEDVWSN